MAGLMRVQYGCCNGSTVWMACYKYRYEWFASRYGWFSKSTNMDGWMGVQYGLFTKSAFLNGLVVVCIQI